jgi:tetratricopeptide (TPR) repeat protein
MLVPLFVALSLTGFASSSAAAPSARAEAVAAYDAGDYASACRILTEMDAAVDLEGTLLYRLFFCKTALGEQASGREALARAATALEGENVPGCPVEVPFYLANAYANLGRPEDARRVASETVLRLETERYEPKSAMEWFQVGKLAQDAGRNDRAETAYRRAVDGFSAGSPAPGHERWARRFLGNAASGRADFEAALPEWRRIVALENADRSDLLALATACARTARWEEAAEAWRLAEKIDMQNGSDPRYAAGLARQAAALGGIPSVDALGVPWSRYDRDGLEAAMRDHAVAAHEVRREAARREEAGAWDRAAREEASERLREIRGRFLAAGIEYAVRKLPLRETAFSGNYATLVFQDSEWELPDAP